MYSQNCLTRGSVLLTITENHNDHAVSALCTPNWIIVYFCVWLVVSLDINRRWSVALPIVHHSAIFIESGNHIQVIRLFESVYMAAAINNCDPKLQSSIWKTISSFIWHIGMQFPGDRSWKGGFPPSIGSKPIIKIPFRSIWLIESLSPLESKPTFGGCSLHSAKPQSAAMAWNAHKQCQLTCFKLCIIIFSDHGCA